jgi:hypothetical protein
MTATIERATEPSPPPVREARAPWRDLGMSWVEKLLGPVPDRPKPRGLDADRRAAVVLWASAVLVLLLVFKGGFPTPGHLYSGWSSVNPNGLGAELFWVSWGYVFYLTIPLAIVLLVFRESPARYGLRFYMTRRTAILYVGMFLVMVPVLVWASTREAFLGTYPFVRDLGDTWVRTIVIWEFAYVARFICLEFFFRGFLLFGLEEKLGYSAIAASTLPYGLIHFAKPFPEAMGAICAGAVLGLLALRTRTILGGAIIHSAVAVSMDILALWRRGFF